ncbi:hypothetical protein V5799_014357 [Amblyomma americanum]|uniref:Uncharacterized protein n=1 Tax=Amblyomma americanum TaxID=6943 RepID=A0AAQ4E3A1_AMBAM
MLLSVSVLFVQKIQSLEASVGERAQKNKHLKEEVSKLQEKVHNLTSETAETRDAEALKRERIERLYREAKEENQFMRRAGSAAKAGVTPSHQLSELVRICEAIPIKPKPPSANTLQVTGKAGGKSYSTKSYGVAATKASKHLQEAKPPVKASPCKGKRPGSVSGSF